MNCVWIAAVDVGSPKDPSPVEAGSPGQTSLTGQGEDSEQAEQVHGDVGSPLATGEEEEESQFPSTQQLFGADSSYVQYYKYT